MGACCHSIGRQQEVVREGELVHAVRVHLGQLRAVGDPVLGAEVFLCTCTQSMECAHLMSSGPV